MEKPLLIKDQLIGGPMIPAFEESRQDKQKIKKDNKLYLRHDVCLFLNKFNGKVNKSPDEN